MVRFRVEMGLQLVDGAGGWPSTEASDLGIHLRRGQLWAKRPELASALAEVVRQAITTGEPQYRAVARPESLPLTLLAEPDQVHGRRAPVQLVLADPHACEISDTALRDMFGLTPAECEVVSRLARGWPPGHIAVTLAVKPNTVAAHLKSALAKTGAGRQSALVALVRGSVACAGSRSNPRSRGDCLNGQ